MMTSSAAPTASRQGEGLYVVFAPPQAVPPKKMAAARAKDLAALPQLRELDRQCDSPSAYGDLSGTDDRCGFARHSRVA